MPSCSYIRGTIPFAAGVNQGLWRQLVRRRASRYPTLVPDPDSKDAAGSRRGFPGWLWDLARAGLGVLYFAVLGNPRLARRLRPRIADRPVRVLMPSLWVVATLSEWLATHPLPLPLVVLTTRLGLQARDRRRRGCRVRLGDRARVLSRAGPPPLTIR